MAKVVLYHAECNDGIMAAAVIAHFEKDPTITYHPVRYSTPMPDLPQGSDIIFADFCHNQLGLMLGLLDQCNTMRIIDHHDGAIANLKALQVADKLTNKLTVNFDEHESGASLAWRTYSSADLPKAVKLVRNHDLHVNKTIEDDYFFYGALTEIQTIAFWHSLLEDDDKVNALIFSGRNVYNFIHNTVLPQARLKLMYTAWQGYSIPVVNVNRVLQSLILDELCKLPMIAMAYEDLGNGKRKWSVRSLPQTQGAAQRLAIEYGGSGHPNAAGFITDATWLPPLVENM